MWGRYIKYTPDTKWWQVWNTIDTLKKRVTEVSTQFWNPGKPKAPIPWLETSHVPWEWFSTLDYESPFTLHYKWPRFNSWVGKSPRGGHSNPLQYSWLENPMDRSAWWAMVHRVAKSWTWLKPLSVHIHMCCSCWHLSAWSLCCTPREGTATRSQHTTKSSPCSPGLEKACAKQQRPVQPEINKDSFKACHKSLWCVLKKLSATPLISTLLWGYNLLATPNIWYMPEGRGPQSPGPKAWWSEVELM